MPRVHDETASLKKRRFAVEFLKDRNGTAAYRRAGYQGKAGHAAESGASKLLRNPEVIALIRTEDAKALEHLRIEAVRVLDELAGIAFFDPRELFDLGGQPLPLAVLPSHVARALAVELDERGAVKKLTPHDKHKALEVLAKYLHLLKDQPPPPQWTLDPATLAKLSTEDLQRALQHADAILALLADGPKEPR